MSVLPLEHSSDCACWDCIYELHLEVLRYFTWLRVKELILEEACDDAA
jgi:hypothetical protein